MRKLILGRQLTWLATMCLLLWWVPVEVVAITTAIREPRQWFTESVESTGFDPMRIIEHVHIVYTDPDSEYRHLRSISGNCFRSQVFIIHMQGCRNGRMHDESVRSLDQIPIGSWSLPLMETNPRAVIGCMGTRSSAIEVIDCNRQGGIPDYGFLRQSERVYVEVGPLLYLGTLSAESDGILRRLGGSLSNDRLPSRYDRSEEAKNYETEGQQSEFLGKFNLPLLGLYVVGFILAVAFVLLGLFALYVVEPALENVSIPLKLRVVIVAGIVVLGQIGLYVGLSFIDRKWSLDSQTTPVEAWRQQCDHAPNCRSQNPLARSSTISTVSWASCYRRIQRRNLNPQNISAASAAYPALDSQPLHYRLCDGCLSSQFFPRQPPSEFLKADDPEIGALQADIERELKTHPEYADSL